MMSGQGPNPIFFNKKIKIGRPEHSLTPQPPAVSSASTIGLVAKLVMKSHYCPRGIYCNGFNSLVLKPRNTFAVVVLTGI